MLFSTVNLFHLRYCDVADVADADYSESDEESERESSPGKLSPSSSVRSLSSGSSSVGSPASHPASPERALPTRLDSSPELTPAETASLPGTNPASVQHSLKLNITLSCNTVSWC